MKTYLSFVSEEKKKRDSKFKISFERSIRSLSIYSLSLDDDETNDHHYPQETEAKEIDNHERDFARHVHEVGETRDHASLR